MIDPKRAQYYRISEAEKRIKLLQNRFPENYGDQIEFRKALDEIRLAKDKIRSYERMIRLGVRF